MLFFSIKTNMISRYIVMIMFDIIPVKHRRNADHGGIYSGHRAYCVRGVG